MGIKAENSFRSEYIQSVLGLHRAFKSEYRSGLGVGIAQNLWFFTSLYPLSATALCMCNQLSNIFAAWSIRGIIYKSQKESTDMYFFPSV